MNVGKEALTAQATAAFAYGEKAAATIIEMRMRKQRIAWTQKS